MKIIATQQHCNAATLQAAHFPDRQHAGRSELLASYGSLRTAVTRWKLATAYEVVFT
ncbi:hypothetical protein [Rubripirellula obstinata]|uniref:hypothetical protein n=1 Tax=Rubripirellula obstinata TaxID=406547 RepID=UPI0012F8E60D|nr:hypothetical protein [Rubripirellula obstinata]